jgi:hypothetical protein
MFPKHHTFIPYALAKVEPAYKHINKLQRWVIGSTSMLLFWGCAQCCKKVGDGPIKMAIGRRRRKK